MPLVGACQTVNTSPRKRACDRSLRVVPPRRADLSDAVFDGSAADSWQRGLRHVHLGAVAEASSDGPGGMSVVVQTGSAIFVFRRQERYACLRAPRLTGRSRHGSAAANAADGATGSAGGDGSIREE